MKVVFSQHALSQIKARNLQIENIFETLNFPDDLVLDPIGNSIAQKRYPPYLLRIVYRIDHGNKFVIMAYKTTKYQKK